MMKEVDAKVGRELFVVKACCMLLMCIAVLSAGIVAQTVDGKAPAGSTAMDRSSLLQRLFYYDEMCGDRVRLRALPLDSLPDEVNIRLIADTADFCFPMKNIITSPYGWRSRWNRPHRGVDILLNTGTPVRSCFPGTVRIARNMGGYGNMVLVRHPNGLETVYAHMSKLLVKAGQYVHAGDTLGLGGSTGHSTGPHLHFEVRFQYEPFDPEWILDFKNYSLRTRRLHLDKTYFGITPPKGKGRQPFKADESIVKEKTVRQQPREVRYTVKRGDTWERVAMMHSTTEERLHDINPGVKKLKAGIEIRIR